MWWGCPTESCQIHIQTLQDIHRRDQPSVIGLVLDIYGTRYRANEPSQTCFPANIKFLVVFHTANWFLGKISFYRNSMMAILVAQYKCTKTTND